MRKVSDLDHEQLVQIVESIQGFLYLDLDNRGTEFWNPDKEWSGADVCEHVAGLLGQHDLVPDSRQSVDGGSYVLYDFDAQRLVSNEVYASYPDAAEDAAGLNDVLILELDVPRRRASVDSGDTGEDN